MQPSAIREFLALAGQPGSSFAGGYPDPTLFPIEQLHKIYDDLLTPANASALQYTASDGTPELRALVAGRLTADGMPCAPRRRAHHPRWPAGSRPGGKTLHRSRRRDRLRTPTFLGALIAFNPCEPAYASVPMDDEGLDTDALEQVLRTTQRVKLIYTVPDFQNPTGRTMSLARRRRLVELADEFDVMVLEDTPYRELRYDGGGCPASRASTPVGGSSILGASPDSRARPAPGMGARRAEIREKLSLLKLAADTQNGTLNMRAAAAYLSGFDIEAHIAGMLPTYRHQRDLMLASIEEHFPAGVRWTRPDGGLFTWVTFPEGLDTAAFQRDHLIPRAGVILVPSAPSSRPSPRVNHARMSFSGVPDDRLVAGVTAMGGLLREVLA